MNTSLFLMRLNSRISWKMLSLLIFLIEILCVISTSLEKSTNRKIIVAVLSERKPFTIIDEIGPPNGLDALMIENFARKFNFQVEYIDINSSLNNEIVKKEASSANYSRYDHIKVVYCIQYYF